MALKAKRNFKTITCLTRDGKFIIYPAEDGKVKVKKEKPNEKSEDLVGYFNLEDSTWYFTKGATIPFSVKNIVEESFCA